MQQVHTIARVERGPPVAKVVAVLVRRVVRAGRAGFIDKEKRANENFFDMYPVGVARLV